MKVRQEFEKKPTYRLKNIRENLFFYLTECIQYIYIRFMERIKMSVVVDDTTKEKAEQLSKETGYNQSQIIELLLKGATKEEILNLYKDVMMGVIK